MVNYKMKTLNMKTLIRKSYLKNLHVPGSAQMDDRILGDAWVAMEKSIKTKSAVIKPNIWRIIMKSKITKVAAAAIIIMGIMVAINYFGRSPDGATMALADTIDAMKKMPWVHGIISDKKAKTEQQGESWVCFDPMIMILKEPEGITYMNTADNALYRYDSKTGVTTITGTIIDEIPGIQSPFDLIEHIIPKFEEQFSKVSRTTRQVNGKMVEVIHGISETEEAMLFLDRERNLLLRMESKKFDKNGDTTENLLMELSYPEQGPKDIYAAGVPENSKIVDMRPKGDEQSLVSEIQHRHDVGYGDYIAAILVSFIDTESNNKVEPIEIQIIRHQKNLTRSSRYWAVDPDRRKSVYKTLYEEVKENWPSLSWQQIQNVENDEALYAEVIFGGKNTINRSRFSGDELKTTTQPSYSFMSKLNVGDTLPSMAWVNIKARTFGKKEHRFEMLTPDSQHKDLVGFRLYSTSQSYVSPGKIKVGEPKVDDYWFDPVKDYLLVKHIQRKDKASDYSIITLKEEVLEFAQTPCGKWHPRHIRSERWGGGCDSKGEQKKSIRDKRVILLVDPVFPEGIFELDHSLQDK